jgi:hypothetical protein
VKGAEIRAYSVILLASATKNGVANARENCRNNDANII